MSMAPTKLWGRVVRTTYVYEGDDVRPTAALTAPEWTEEDLALLRGLALYEATLCPGCGKPKILAWHKHTEEEWDPRGFVCHACSAEQGHEIVYASPTLTMSDQARAELPPFNMDTMTTEPTKRTPGG